MGSNLSTKIWFLLKKIFNILKKAKRNLNKRRHNSAMIDYFEIHLTDHCNLNCASCCHFSSLAEKYFMSVTQFTNDFEQLSRLCNGHIRRLRLLGGEPLLHPDVIRFIEVARKNFPESKIALCTNGILLKTISEEFWKACFENDIEIDISYYPIALDYTSINEMALRYKVLLLTRQTLNMLRRHS